jgi:GPH family glycoside/pentoside/hexuronide:cation symporter
MEEIMRDLGVDRQGIPLTLGQKALWGYGAGGLGVGTFSSIAGLLIYFYTDKVGFSAAMAGSAILVAKVVDACTDLIMGHIVDRTKTRWGKARPYLLFTAILAVIAIGLLFGLPKEMSDTGKFVYIVLTNVFATAIVSTAFTVSLNCLLYYSTRSQLERTKMAVRRAILSNVMSIFIFVAFIPLTAALGGTNTVWLICGILVGAVTASGILICFLTSKEVIQDQDEDESKDTKVSFFKGIKILFTNKYWLIIAVARVIADVATAMAGATGAYYARWVFGDESLVGIMGAIGMIPMVIGLIVITPLIKRFTAIDVCRGALILGILAGVFICFFPRNLILYPLFVTLMSVGRMPFSMLDNVMLGDIADFEEWRSGIKMPGLVQSVSSFGIKVGSGLGAAIVGFVLALGGYQAAADTQPSSAITSIFAVSIWIPIGLMALMLLLLLAYNIDKKYPRYRQELFEKQHGKEARKEDVDQ